MSCRTRSYIALPPFSCNSLKRRRARASSVAVTKSLASASGQTTVPISRPSSTRPPGEVALEGEQGVAHRGNRRHHRGGARDILVAQPGIVEVAGADAFGRRPGYARVGRIAAGGQGMERRRAVELAGVEMRQLEMLRQAPAEGALAGGRRPVDGDNHGATGAILAPSPFISVTKPGKLVPMVSPSSIRVGRRAAMPSTRKAMAMRWSSRV